MNSPVIAIIGAGNMGSSLVHGLIRNGHPSEKLWVASPSEEKLEYLYQQTQVKTALKNTQAASVADVILFAVKPQVLESVAKSLRDTVQERKPLIISIVAGIHEKHIQAWLGGEVAVVRAMPNTPALINAGATALYANSLVSLSQRNMAESILRAVGMVVWLEKENLMDAVTALSGSGPAYFFLLMEALQHVGEELGLPGETARLLTMQTALGAARMAIESGASPAELRRQVTSPGGTTEQAIAILEKNHMRELFQKAVYAAKEHSEKLAALLGEKNNG